jgi:photosystem II stability/assembly factor-like uncharacterized protein
MLKTFPSIVLRSSLCIVFIVILVGVALTQSPITPIIPKNFKPKTGLVRIVSEVSFDRLSSHPNALADLVFDDSFAYLATPGGLYRTTLPLSSQSSFKLIGFQDTNIFRLYVHLGSLYVLKESVANAGTAATDHSILRSDDHGSTFVPIDGALQECGTGFCEYLAATQAMFVGHSLIVNAGFSNLLITDDNGESWTPLLGGFHRGFCAAEPFEMIGHRMIVGGDCPLENGFIESGILSSNRSGWVESPALADTPNMNLRSVLTIRSKPNSTDVYAGVYAGLLKSTDGGQSFRFVFVYPTIAASDPFVKTIFFPSHAPNVIVAAGRDSGRLFLAYSKDNGETWLDISPAVQPFIGALNDSGLTSVDFIKEDSQGNIFAGVVYNVTRTFKLLQLNFNAAAFR